MRRALLFAAWLVWSAPLELAAGSVCFAMTALGGLRYVGMGGSAVIFALRWQWLMAGWARGCALPGVILVRYPVDARVLEHEARHVRQWRALGLLFPLAYLALTLVFGYRDNPLEIDARAHEG